MEKPLITVNMYDFDTLLTKVVEESNLLNEYFQLNFIYHQLISGHGLEFDRIREYQHGDDVRRIDWKIFARRKELFTRAYKEERQFDIIIVVDVSDSMLLGTAEKTKSEYAALVAGTLAFSATQANDQVALVMGSSKKWFNSDTENEYSQIIHNLSIKEYYGGEKDWQQISNKLLENYRKESIIFIISDFINTNPDSFLAEMSAAFSKVYGIMIRDPIDLTLPENAGPIYLQGTSDSNVQLTDLKKAREQYEKLAQEEMAKVKESFNNYGQMSMEIITTEKFATSFIKALGGEKVIVV